MINVLTSKEKQSETFENEYSNGSSQTIRQASKILSSRNLESGCFVSVFYSLTVPFFFNCSLGIIIHSGDRFLNKKDDASVKV